MSRKDRLLNILDFLNDHSFVTVDTLSRHFFISPPTVYRDLRELEEQMLIIRGNGGAMRISADRTSMPLDIRRTIHAKAKAAIAHIPFSFWTPPPPLAISLTASVPVWI